MTLSFREVAELLRYEPEAGCFFWQLGRKAGQAAGSDKGDGYWTLWLRGKGYKAHRIAWLLHYGQWPDGDLDHINGNRADNRIANLRLCTNQQNQRNRRPNPRASNGGLKGALKRHGRWQARIKVDDKTIHLGTFDTVHEAHAAYVKAADAIFGEFARTA